MDSCPFVGLFAHCFKIISVLITIAREYRVYSNPETDSVRNLEIMKVIIIHHGEGKSNILIPFLGRAGACV